MGNTCCTNADKTNETFMVTRKFRNVEESNQDKDSNPDNLIHVMSFNVLSESACKPYKQIHATDEMRDWKNRYQLNQAEISLSQATIKFLQEVDNLDTY